MALLDVRALTAARLYVRFRERTVIWKLRVEPWGMDEGKWYAWLWSPGDKIYCRKLATTQDSMWVTFANSIAAAAERAREELEKSGRHVLRVELLIEDEKVEPMPVRQDW